MFGLLSSSLMMFADRFLLARYSLEAFNASANAGLATYLFMIFPLTIVGISEVFVGRFHGESAFKQLGNPVWQMLWLSFATIPFFSIATRAMAPYIFSGTGFEEMEIVYFNTFMDFAPFSLGSVALMGFFMATGRVRLAAICTLFANFFNVILDVILIFGWGFFPEMGIKGATLATGLSQMLQFILLMSFFINKKNRRKYGTLNWQYNKPLFMESLKIATPAGLGHLVEIIAHFVFFRIMIKTGVNNLTIVVIVQSFYHLVGFSIEAVSKGVTAVVSNLLGAGKTHLIRKTLNSAFKLHLLFALVITTVFFLFPKEVIHVFLSGANQDLLNDSLFFYQLKMALFWGCIFFVFDGFTWILIGQLTAAGDTRFIFCARNPLKLGCLCFPHSIF